VEKLPRRILAARVIALVADAVQLGFLPIFAGGAPTGFDAVLDVVVAGVMVALCGWHWAFLPAFAAEMLPVVDLAPTWTIAVLLATRGKATAARKPEPVVATRVDDSTPPRPPAPPPPLPPPLPPGR
jgi:hypothetical protein